MARGLVNLEVTFFSYQGVALLTYVLPTGLTPVIHYLKFGNPPTPETHSLHNLEITHFKFKPYLRCHESICDLYLPT